ncbi:site-specific integrase [Aquiluna sp.]|nr:site-specific integrase [Aquiluna sp.]MDA8992674.1 site-specific integrase [Aquiluna sp.]
MAERISIWSYETSKGRKWAYEVRFPLHAQKLQKRGFSTSKEALLAGKQVRLQWDSRGSQSRDVSRVSLVAEEYLESLTGAVKEHTRANYKAILDSYVLPKIGHLKVQEVAEPDISAILNTLRKRGLLPGTVNTVRARAIGLFNYALRRRIITFNPAAETNVHRVNLPEDTQVQEPLSSSEARLLLQASEGTQLQIFIALCLGLGLRKGEALALRWSDVDIERGSIKITKSRGQRKQIRPDKAITSNEMDGDTKTKSSIRELPLGSTVLIALHKSLSTMEPSPDDYLVTSRDGLPLSLSVLHRKFKLLLREAGVRRVRIHDLRHSAANLASESLVPLEAVSQALGHSSIEVTKRIYAPRVKALNGLFTAALDDSLGAHETDLVKLEEAGNVR